MSVDESKSVLNNETCFSKLNNNNKDPNQVLSSSSNSPFFFPFSLRHFLLEVTPFFPLSFVSFLCINIWPHLYLSLHRVARSRHTRWRCHHVYFWSSIHDVSMVATTNSIVTNIPVYTLKTFFVVWYIARSEMAGSLGRHIFNAAFTKVMVSIQISSSNNLIFLSLLLLKETS